MSAGKGDTPRPVNGEAFRSNHDDIFRKGKIQICEACGKPMPPLDAPLSPFEIREFFHAITTCSECNIKALLAYDKLLNMGGEP